MQVKILWADDEIELLKPHILFLESKGYEVVSVNNGISAVEENNKSEFNMVFLDENGVRMRYGVNGEPIPRTDDLPDILGGADLDGPIMEGQSDEFIP